MSEPLPFPNKVLIASATRGVGAQVARRLRQLGVPSRALVRDPARAADLGDVEIVPGDAMRAEDCRTAAEGCDAVICTMGERKVPRDRPPVDGDGVINLADAALAAGARRFVLVSTLGAGESWNWLPFFVKWYFQALRLRPILAEKTRSDDHVRSLDLDWTILWPGGLTNRPMRAAPLLTVDGRAGGMTSRQAVADVAVRCLASANAIGRTIIVVDPLMRFMFSRGGAFDLDAGWQPWTENQAR